MKTTRNFCSGCFLFLRESQAGSAKGVGLVEVLRYAFFPFTAVLEAAMRVAYSQWAVLAVATHDYGEVSVVAVEEEQEEFAA